jgi:hypothetical protein
MLPIIWAKSLERSKWSSKDYNEDRTKGPIIVSIPIGGGKNPPHTKKKVLKGATIFGCLS